MPFFTLTWLRRAVLLASLLVAALVAGFRAQAQPTTPAATSRASDNAYTGPRFPGGPDSLRTLLGRILRHASPSLTGQLFLLLELNKAGVPARASYLRPSTSADIALGRTKEAQDLTQQLLAQLPPWQPDPSTQNSDNNFGGTVVLPLTFGPNTAPVPLVYSDEKPVFPLPIDARAPLAAPPYLTFLQRQFRYPVADLRNHVQGTVYAYFEVSETGAVEQRRIAGSLSPTIDAELLRALQTLPNASQPPRHQGQPVRVAYVVPISLSIR